MTATDTECVALYLRLSVSQLTGLPAVVTVELRRLRAFRGGRLE